MAAAASGTAWRWQRRALALLPEAAANSLLGRLLAQRERVSPAALELFRHAVTQLALSAEAATPQRLAVLAEFRCPRPAAVSQQSPMRWRCAPEQCRGP